MDEVNFHISRFHRELAEIENPQAAYEYARLHKVMDDHRKAISQAERDLRDLINSQRLKKAKNPKLPAQVPHVPHWQWVLKMLGKGRG